MMTEQFKKSGTRQNPLRIGCINIMPEAHTYEPFLLSSLEQSGYKTKPVWIRLKSHGYRSTPAAHLARYYVTFEAALAAGPLDGLVITGAPVETFPFSTIHYWPELAEILNYAKESIPSTLGLCWGGIALGKAMGMDEEVYEKKLFGVFSGLSLDPGISLGDNSIRFYCPHSRFAGISVTSLKEAVNSGDGRILAIGPETGPFIFESRDKRFLGHLGHPEYPASRLAHEWERDREKGKADVLPPAHFNPKNPENTWQGHTNAFFSYWLGNLQKQNEDKENKVASATGRGNQ
ncbi:MAG: homoserine O-succinyltransferase [Acidobacteria bacterium]|nr:homoserine O-succinyltransferase [Acidobacteriota bacterium]